jgi:hypothetical protein
MASCDYWNAHRATHAYLYLPEHIAEEFHRHLRAAPAGAPEARSDHLEDLQGMVLDLEHRAHCLLLRALRGAVAAVAAHHDAGDDGEVAQQVAAAVLPQLR